jgi:hypothetical protein
VETNVFWFKNIPNTIGLIENDPDICLFRLTIFFLLRIIETTTDKYLSHVKGLNAEVIQFEVLEPFEKTVTLPELFRPELFLTKILKNLLILGYLIKKLLFLNLCVEVVGLYVLIKI